jgi:hypothetical protein
MGSGTCSTWGVAARGVGVMRVVGGGMDSGMAVRDCLGVFGERATEGFDAAVAIKWSYT